jgi:cell division protein FtsB
MHACNNPRTAKKFSRNLILSIFKIDQHSSFGKNQITTVYTMTTQNRKTEEELQENRGER